MQARTGKKLSKLNCNNKQKCSRLELLIMASIHKNPITKANTIPADHGGVDINFLRIRSELRSRLGVAIDMR